MPEARKEQSSRGVINARSRTTSPFPAVPSFVPPEERSSTSPPTTTIHDSVVFISSSVFLASDGHAGADQHDGLVHRLAESHHELHAGGSP